MSSIPYSPMQPTRFSVTEVSVRANPDFKPAEGITHLPRVNLNAEFGEGVTEAGAPVYVHRLRVIADSQSSDAAVPFEATVTVEGAFAIVNEATVEESTLRQLATQNGFAMLYGFARDVLLFHTATSPRGPFMLPAINLVGLAAEILQSRQEQESAPATPDEEGE